MTHHHRFQSKVAYVCKRYPRFSETFIVNEILAHEAAGLALEIFALRTVEETHFQDQISKVRSPVTHIPTKLKQPQDLWKLIRQAEVQFPDSTPMLLAMEHADAHDVAQAIVLALACGERGITHLHAHFGTCATTVARIAGAIAGIPYSFTAHAKDIYHDYASPTRMDLKLRDAAAVVTVSDYNLGHLRAAYGATNVRRIYNGIDLGRFAYAPPKPGATELLAVGRLVEKKGFHILLEAISLMRQQGETPHCTIIGAGEEEENLRAQIAASHLSDAVTLSGPMPQRDVIIAMQKAAVIACPCIVGRDGNRDGLPTVLLEAMALGTPCVATAVTGIPELVRDGDTGLCVAEGDPTALAAALSRMINDHMLRTRVSRKARALIEKEFDILRSAAALRQVFDEAAVAQEPIKGVV
ncbi:glycosyltransferase [Roseobacter sinensis]|uniref:Glycosyltransferase n=1 Tax=Roseobacter sinensis TaxID=2931391 RepID=A0ABT3BIF4_9RHOB|nr:glycosyltransferase [Roseobacter sp. WL0113]MCV3273342.1 glycosyltransferase [Roseobacter sp. WL0113]